MPVMVYSEDKIKNSIQRLCEALGHANLEENYNLASDIKDLLYERGYRFTSIKTYPERQTVDMWISAPRLTEINDGR